MEGETQMAVPNPNALRPASARPPRPGYILLVEDDDALRTIMVSELQSHGYRVEGAEGVEGALKPFEGGGCLLDRSSLLITDMKLPNGHTGLELLAYLRTHNLSIPAIAMSAMFNSPGWPREQAVREAGASEVMYKPLDIEELVSKIQNYIHHT